MSPLWSYLWPVFGAGLVIGALAATIGFRRDSPRLAMAIGFVATLGAAALWHGPAGGADRFSGRVERSARQALEHYEMTAVTAQLSRGPLSRQLVLSGPADGFQRQELVRLFGQVPGASGATWDGRRRSLPLAAEGIGAAVAAFLLGLGLAYLVELRRRYNAQWTW